MKKTITIEGTEFSSLTKATEHYGVKLGTFTGRLKAGWTPEQAAGVEPAPEHGKSITIEGTEFPSLTKAAEHYGVHLRAFCDRLKAGWTPEQAVGVEPAPQRLCPGKQVVCHGVTYPSIAMLAADYNMPEKVVRSRLRAGLSPEQAVVRKRGKRKTPSRPHFGPVTVWKLRFRSLNAAQQYYRDPEHAKTQDRVRAGMAPEKALGYARLRLEEWGWVDPETGLRREGYVSELSKAHLPIEEEEEEEEAA